MSDSFIDVTSNIIHTGSDGETLGDGDEIFVDSGVKLEGLSSGATNGATFDGIDANQATVAGISAVIDGLVAGSFDGICADDAGSNHILIGQSGSVISTSTASNGGYGIDLGLGLNTVTNDGQIIGPNGGIHMAISGSDTVINNGTIDAYIGSAVLLGGGNSTITNAGTMDSSNLPVIEIDENRAHGGNIITNTGLIEGHAGIAIKGTTGFYDEIHNSGTITGLNDAIIELGTGGLKVSNDGFMKGSIQFDSASSADKLDNAGTIDAGGVAITEIGSAGTLTITNTGHINGDILFGDGRGIYNGSLGTITGSVTGSAVNDTLKGGAGDDVFNGGIGNDLLKGGDGDDILNGGAGADRLVGGAGNNTFVYASVSESHGVASHDTIVGFDALNDSFSFDVAVTGVDAAVTTGSLSNATFNTDMQTILTATALLAHHAVLVTPDSGDLAGHTYLVVDDNGTAGYQAASDYLIQLNDAAHLSNLSTDNFS